MNSHLLIAIDQFKNYIKDTTATSDLLYGYLVSRASAEIERICKRKLRARTITEYRDGLGRNWIDTKEWPIIGTTADVDLYDDLDRAFSSTYKFEDDDWVLTGEQGRIELLSDSSLGSVFQKGVKNVKIVYTGGYENFEVVTGYNDTIDFNEGGAEFTATLTAGDYTGAGLATEIDTQLTEEGAGSYTISYNRVTSKFTLVKSAGTFQLLWSSGTNATTSAGDLIGFAVSADDTGALTYTSDYSRPGTPDDLQQACIFLMDDWLMKSHDGGETIFNKKSITTTQAGGGTLAYKTEAIPTEVTEILRPYIRINL